MLLLRSAGVSLYHFYLIRPVPHFHPQCPIDRREWNRTRYSYSSRPGKHSIRSADDVIYRDYTLEHRRILGPFRFHGNFYRLAFVVCEVRDQVRSKWPWMADKNSL